MSKGSEPAFAAFAGQYPDVCQQTGLSKREMFAAMAMQGLVAYGFSTDPSSASDLAVKHADALIAELEKSNDQN